MASDQLGPQGATQAGSSDRPVLVLIGPSAAGKSTVARELQRSGTIRIHPTRTTRPPRPGELAESVEHRFVSEDDFERRSRDGFFFAEGSIAGLPYRYGLPALDRSSTGPVDAVLLRAPHLPAFRRLVPDCLVYQIADTPDRLHRRLGTRASSPGELAARTVDNAHELAAGLAVADRTFENTSTIHDLARRVAAALAADVLPAGTPNHHPFEEERHDHAVAIPVLGTTRTAHLPGVGPHSSPTPSIGTASAAAGTSDPATGAEEGCLARGRRRGRGLRRGRRSLLPGSHRPDRRGVQHVGQQQMTAVRPSDRQRRRVARTDHPTLLQRARLLVLLARPPVLLLAALYGSLGLAAAGHAGDVRRLAGVLVAAFSCLIFAVAVNDLTDEAIDRVNLPGERGRPLVSGGATRREMTAVALTCAGLALAASCLLRWQAVVVSAAALGLCLAYSLRPVRIAERGIIAPLLLPAGFVAMPFLLGVLSAGAQVTPADLALLGALYVGFIGRIVLKDFRDVRGDTLFGKRTFLVRRGRRATCVLAGVCWLCGASVLAALPRVTPALGVAVAALVGTALLLLRALAAGGGARRDEWCISAIAIVGRGFLVVLLAHFGCVQARWSVPAQAVLLAALTAVTLGQAWTMFRHGPRSRLTVARVLAAGGRPGIRGDAAPPPAAGEREPAARLVVSP